jgi:predicted ester cyclase
MHDSSSPSHLAYDWFQQVWNERDESAIDRMLNPRGQVQGLAVRDATSLRGPEEFKYFHRALLSAIPDLRVTVGKVIEQEGWVAVHFVCEGTHTGQGIGVAPSNSRVNFSGMAMGKVENGQWVEGWNSIDFLTLNQQIGGMMRIE